MGKYDGPRTLAKFIVKKPGFPEEIWLSLELFPEEDEQRPCVRCKTPTTQSYKLFREYRERGAGFITSDRIRQQSVCPHCVSFIDEALWLLVDPEFLEKHHTQSVIEDGKYVLTHKHQRYFHPLMYALWEFGLWGFLPRERYELQLQQQRDEKDRLRKRHEEQSAKKRTKREQLKLLRGGMIPVIETALQSLTVDHPLTYKLLESNPKRASYEVQIAGRSPIVLLFFPVKEQRDGYYSQPREIPREDAVWLVEFETLPDRILDALGL